MKLLVALALTALPYLASAQLSPKRIPSVLTGAILEPNQTLVVVFGGNGSSRVPINTPGQLVQKQDVAQAPQLGLPTTRSLNSTNTTAPRNTTAQYAALLIDPNVNNSVPTSALLHYLVRDLSLSNASLYTSALNGVELKRGAVLASWRQPNAPNVAHNYTFLLFKQPAAWSIPDNYTRFFGDGSNDRRNFPVIDFLKASKLGTLPVAATYFMEGGISNSTSSPTGDISSTIGGSTMSGNSSGILGPMSPSSAPTMSTYNPATRTDTVTATATRQSGSGAGSGPTSASAQPTQTAVRANVGAALEVGGILGLLAGLTGGLFLL